MQESDRSQTTIERLLQAQLDAQAAVDALRRSQATYKFQPPPNQQYWADRGVWDAYQAGLRLAILAERERCIAIVRRFRLNEHADIMLQEIGNGG